MSDVATLGIRVDSKGAVTATKDLKKLESQGGKTEKRAISMGKAFAAAGVAAATAFAFNLLKVNREFESLRSSLITTTGSAENATIAFKGIQEFAAKTPFAISELTDAFIKLGNLGLAPSERALTSYGNTAGALGVSLNQVVEAVADATTGEFERLKSFGITTKSEADKVKFTFRGLTREVGKNAAEIQDFLIGLGENEFASGMKRQADTIDGAISNMSDSWDSFLDNLLDADAESAIGGAFRFIGNSIDWLDSKINSSKLDELNGEIADLDDKLTKLYDLSENPFVNWSINDEDVNKEFNELNNQMQDLIDKRDKLINAESQGPSFDEMAAGLDTVKNTDAKTGSKGVAVETAKQITIDSDKIFDAWSPNLFEDFAEDAEMAMIDSEAVFNDWAPRLFEDFPDEMSEFAIQAARNMETALSGGFFDIMQGNFDDLGSSFKRTIDQMVADLLASQLLDFIKDTASSGALGSFAQGIAASFDGGGFTGDGPRSGGVDGKGGFPAIMHPNETVIDHTKNQSAAPANITINISGVKDEGGLRRSAAQIAQSAGLAANRAQTRNG
mgnify:CR=1 FL=1